MNFSLCKRDKREFIKKQNPKPNLHHNNATYIIAGTMIKKMQTGVVHFK
jgi:hypothetical protein